MIRLQGTHSHYRHSGWNQHRCIPTHLTSLTPSQRAAFRSKGEMETVHIRLHDKIFESCCWMLRTDKSSSSKTNMVSIWGVSGSQTRQMFNCSLDLCTTWKTSEELKGAGQDLWCGEHFCRDLNYTEDEDAGGSSSSAESNTASKTNC